MPQGEFVMVRGAGHLTMIDAPEETNRTIRDFIDPVSSNASE